MKLIPLIFLCSLLAGCATADFPVPAAKDLSTVTPRLEMAVSFAEKNGEAILRRPVQTQAEAYAELHRLYPGTVYAECCEHAGWFVFSSTPADSALRFHNGHAVEKGGRRVYTFGFW